MASLNIEQLDEAVAERLRSQAQARGQTVEAEAAALLREALAEETPRDWGRHLLDTIQAEFGPLGGVELDLPPRYANREPPRFDDF